MGWGPVPPDVPWVENKLKLKPGLGAFHAIRPRSGLGLFYSSRYPHGANKPQDMIGGWGLTMLKLILIMAENVHRITEKMSKVILVILSKVILLC